MKDNMERAELYISIKNELESKLNKGIVLTLEGRASTPDQIAGLCVFCEESNYMRDYVTDESGNLVELGFNDVQNS